MDTAVTIEPATLAQWNDVEQALTGGGDGRSCQCAWWTLTNTGFNTTTADERQALLHDEIAAGPPPGPVAYVDGEAAGWVRIGPRIAQARLARTRNIVGATSEPLDDPRVWAVTCFSIRREHRGEGLTAALLDAAIDYARGAGARLIEAYPTDTAMGTHRANSLFLGTLATFLAAGFAVVGERKPGHPLVALTLGN